MDSKDIKRFESKILKLSCWYWIGSLNSSGYGQFYLKGHMHKAHRVSYELYIGPIPEGFQLDHLCRHRDCVNPKHLEAVTQQENLNRSPRRHVTHCPKNHEYTEENTYITSQGWRMCRKCTNDRTKS